LPAALRYIPQIHRAREHARLGRSVLAYSQTPVNAPYLVARMSNPILNPAPTWRVKRPHRIAIATATPRTFAFLLVFALGVWVAQIRLEGWSLVLPGAFLLLWPGIAFTHAALAPDSKRAEFTNLYVDCLILGAWCAALHYYVWATFVIGTGGIMNNMVIGGFPRAAVATTLFGAGAVVGGILTDFDFTPYAGLGPDIFISTGALVYFLALGHAMYGQNRKIGRNIAEIKNQNRVFHSLLDLGVIAYQARDVDTLLDESLGHLSARYPEYGFAVLLMVRARPGVVRCAAARGISANVRRRLTDTMAHLGERRDSTFEVYQDSDGRHLYATSMANRLSAHDGWLVVRAPEFDDALERMLTLFADQLAAATENKLLHQALQTAAERDGLTGLYNRGYFESELQRSIGAKRQLPKQDFSVLMVDVDGLKTVNDQLGHVAGDTVVTTVATLLAENCRKDDILARYGGDEFVVLCPSPGSEAASRVAEWIRTNVEGQRQPVSTSGGQTVELVLRLSIGSASSAETSPQEVLALADRRMYQDKTKRRTSTSDRPELYPVSADA